MGRIPAGDLVLYATLLQAVRRAGFHLDHSPMTDQLSAAGQAVVRHP